MFDKFAVHTRCFNNRRIEGSQKKFFEFGAVYPPHCVPDGQFLETNIWGMALEFKVFAATYISKLLAEAPI